MLYYKAALACVFAVACNVLATPTASIPMPFPTDVEPAFKQLTDLNAKYGNTVVSPATDGIEIPVPQVASAPSFSTSSTLSGNNVLIMIDPDAKVPQILHLLQPGMISASKPDGNGNVPLSASVAPAAPYHSPGPPAGTGKHRYTFFLFKQPEGFKLSPSFNASNRMNFNIVKFATEYCLGAPIAGSFFLAEFQSANLTTGNGTVVNGTSSGGNRSSTGNSFLSPSVSTQTTSKSSTYVASIALAESIALVSVGVISL